MAATFPFPEGLSLKCCSGRYQCPAAYRSPEVVDHLRSKCLLGATRGIRTPFPFITIDEQIGWAV